MFVCQHGSNRHSSALIYIFFLMIPPPPRSALFPYTTLFRSSPRLARAVGGDAQRPRAEDRAAAAGLHRLRRARSSADRKSTRLNSSHANISYAVFCLKKKKGESSSTPDHVEQREGHR